MTELKDAYDVFLAAQYHRDDLLSSPAQFNGLSLMAGYLLANDIDKAVAVLNNYDASDLVSFDFSVFYRVDPLDFFLLLEQRFTVNKGYLDYFYFCGLKYASSIRLVDGYLEPGKIFNYLYSKDVFSTMGFGIFNSLINLLMFKSTFDFRGFYLLWQKCDRSWYWQVIEEMLSSTEAKTVVFNSTY